MTKPAFKLSLRPYRSTPLPVYFDYDDFQKKFNIESREYVPSGKVYRCNDTDNYGMYVKNPWCISTVTHELAHICVYLLSVRGVSIHADDDEAFAYFIGWLAEQYIAGLTKYDRKHK